MYYIISGTSCYSIEVYVKNKKDQHLNPTG